MPFQEKDTSQIQLGPRCYAWLYKNREDLYPDGEWLTEKIDGLQVVDPHTGYTLLVRRVKELGSLCGYACLPPDHAFCRIPQGVSIMNMSQSGASLDEISDAIYNPTYYKLEAPNGSSGSRELMLTNGLSSDALSFIDAHGGITWVGETDIIDYRTGMSNAYKVLAVGFDCAHSTDVVPKLEAFHSLRDYTTYKNIFWVLERAAELAAELSKYHYWQLTRHKVDTYRADVIAYTYDDINRNGDLFYSRNYRTLPADSAVYAEGSTGNPFNSYATYYRGSVTSRPTDF
jgi:hypothetical protein